MLRRLLALLLAALPLAIFTMAVPGTTAASGTAADTPTPQASPPPPAVDATLKAQGDERAGREAQTSAQAGDAAGTLDQLTSALEFYRQAGDVDGEVATLFYFAMFYRQGKHYAEALDYYQQALEAGRVLGSPVFEVGVSVGIGDMQVLLGQQRLAVGAYTQAITLLRQGDDRGKSAHRPFRTGQCLLRPGTVRRGGGRLCRGVGHRS